MNVKNLSEATELIQTAWRLRAEILNAQSQAQMTLVHQHLTDAVTYLRTAKPSIELVNALRKLGHVEQDLGHKEHTKTLYEEACKVSRELGNDLLIAHSVRHLGDFNHDVGDHEAAEKHYSEALTLYTQHQPTPKLDYANAVRAMAVLKQAVGKNSEAIPLWQEAKDLYADVGIAEGVEECEQHLT